MNAALRVAVLLVAGVCAMAWFVAAHASIADTLPLKGIRLGLWTTLVFLLAVWPALVLAICNVALRVAAALAAFGAVAYVYVFTAYLPPPSGTGLLTFAALFTLLVLVCAIFGIFGDHPAEAAFAQARLRLGALYVAGMGTVLWFSSFEPVIRLAGDPRAKGFHVIPAFYGTIFFLVFVLPLLVIGLRGTERRNPAGVRLLLATILAASTLFGVPQLFA